MVKQIDGQLSCLTILKTSLPMILLYLFLGFGALLLIIAAFLPSKYHVEHSAIIKRPAAEVMNKVGDFNYFFQWNPWQKPDPKANYQISGTPHTAGHRMTWEGKKIGKGQNTLVGIDEKHIHFKLEFLAPWKATANDDWLFEDWGASETKVTWQNAGKLSYPVARLIGASMRKQLQKQFVQGLNNLRKLCEG